MIEQYDLLLCLQGVKESQPALAYGLHLAELLRRPVTVLAVGGRVRSPAALETQVDQAVERLQELGLPFTVERASGHLADVVPPYTRQRPYFTVFNAAPQSMLRRVLYGGRFRRMLATMQGPFLRARSVCWPPRRVLVCTGGLSYAGPLEMLSTELAHLTGAQMSLLHVVPPVTLHYDLAERLAHNWENLLETDTPQARHLKQALESARQAGVQTEVKVRHGPVVEEILAEIHEGYDLVGLGSPYASQSLSRLYRPNITASVAAQVSCPILTIH